MAGTGQQLPADQALREIKSFMRKNNLSPADVARLTGIARQNFNKLLNGKRKSYIMQSTVDRILSIEVTTESRLKVPTTATVYRLQAAATVGWGQNQMRAIRSDLMTLSHIQRQSFMLVSTAQKYIDFYQHAITNPIENSYCAARARARGWLPPSTWDADAMLDPYWDGNGWRMSEQKRFEGKELYMEFLFLRSVGVSKEDALAKVNQDQWWLTKCERKWGESA